MERGGSYTVLHSPHFIAGLEIRLNGRGPDAMPEQIKNDLAYSSVIPGWAYAAPLPELHYQ